MNTECASKGNILIDDQGNPRLCDFGISRILTEAGGTGLTTTSPHTGTEPYLSYELVVWEGNACTPTTASDVHALACIGLEVSRENY
jgi:serine/threonine protein kinase